MKKSKIFRNFLRHAYELFFYEWIMEKMSIMADVSSAFVTVLGFGIALVTYLSEFTQFSSYFIGFILTIYIVGMTVINMLMWRKLS